MLVRDEMAVGYFFLGSSWIVSGRERWIRRVSLCAWISCVISPPFQDSARHRCDKLSEVN